MSASTSAAQEESARRNYNRLSGVYSLLSDRSEERFVATAIDELLQPQPGEVILEPGFGTGQVLVALAEAVGPHGRVAGIDISDGMLGKAQQLLEKHEVADRVTLTLGSAAALPYADATFDAVFMSFTLELFPVAEVPLVLAEVARVLKPTGRLAVASMSDEGGIPTMEKLYEWSHRVFPKVVDCRPINAGKFLTEAGFSIEAHRGMSMWGLAVDLTLARIP